MMRAPWSAAQTMPAATSTSLPEPVAVEHLDREDRRLRSDAGLGQAVALDLRHGAGDMGAVPVVVDRFVAAGDHVPAGEQTPGEVGSGGHARVDDGDDDAGTARDRPRRRDADGVETPLLRTPRIGCRESRAPAGGARARRSARRASAVARARRRPMGRRHVHDDHAQARDSADLDGVCRLERPRATAPGRRPTAMASPARAAPGSSRKTRATKAGTRRRGFGGGMPEALPRVA